MKILKWTLIVLAVLALLFYFVGMPYLKSQTKKISPERTSLYQEDGLDLSITYSSPSKKGRVIFGELVPFDKVWRTGANEPTRFVTKTDIRIMGEVLPAGTYSFWTIPGEKNWSVIFNSDMPGWGATMASGGKEATRDADADVLQVDVPVSSTTVTVEQFTIAFENNNGLFLTLAWDTTKVEVPINQ